MTRDPVRLGRSARLKAFVSSLVLTSMIASACGSSTSTPTGPSNPSNPLAGTWLGPITDSTSGSGTLRIDLFSSQVGSLYGNWSATFLNLANNGSGTLTGPPPGSALVFAFTCGSAAGTLQVDVNGTRMTGSYFAGCTGVHSGTVDLTKQ
jgi:hypothetical protein